MHVLLLHPNWFLMMYCYMGTSNDVNKLIAFSDMEVGMFPKARCSSIFP